MTADPATDVDPGAAGTLARWLQSGVALLERRFGLALAVLALLSFAVRVWFADFDQFMIKDPYEYLVRAIRFAEGSFEQRAEQHLGWPLLLSFFVDPDAALLESIERARALGIAVSCLTVVPLGLVARRVAGAPTALATLVIYSLFPPLVKSASFGHTDPLFGLLFLSFVYAIFRAEERPTWLLLAGLLGGLSYWVRPNGLFLLPMLGLGWWVWHRRPHGSSQDGSSQDGSSQDGSSKYLWIGLAAFALAAAPYFVWRLEALGSPFDYGENAKYLVDKPRELWNPTVAAPTLADYFSTRSLGRVFQKFVVGGIWYVLRDYFFFASWPFLSAALAVGVLMGLGERRRRVILGLILIWNIGLIPFYDVYFSQRHILPTLTLALVLAADALLRLGGKASTASLGLVVMFFAPFTLGSTAELLRMKDDASKGDVTSGLEWARWSIENLEGRVAIGEGRDLVDIAAREGGKQRRLAPRFEVVRLPPFDTSTEAIDWMRAHRIRYIVVDAVPYMQKGRKYLNDLLGELPPTAREVFSNRENERSRWPVRILEVTTATSAIGSTPIHGLSPVP
ncbi:MAG: glycosyltransferase family 39 protein [Deltaproteobacteria bacterium]|nr:glycosyltransferase family 39 protein [Deltaproteobacteria bacterium]